VQWFDVMDNIFVRKVFFTCWMTPNSTMDTFILASQAIVVHSLPACEKFLFCGVANRCSDLTTAILLFPDPMALWPCSLIALQLYSLVPIASPVALLPYSPRAL
jgi:hypothetical protein